MGLTIASRGHADGLKSRPALFCFSHLRWNFVWQRPQHLLTRAAQTYDVFFFEEPVLKPGVTPHLDISFVAPQVSVLVPVLPEGRSQADLASLQKELIQGYLDSLPRQRRVFWYYTPAALAFTRDLSRDVTVYDNMDELSAFRGASGELVQYEIDLLAKADIVFTGGRSLFEAKQTRHRNIHCFPSSIDVQHFAAARLKLQQDPADQAAIAHPRIGFFGVIDERMDLGLLRHVSDLRPDWQFVMIGPAVKIAPEELPRARNIHWLGMRSYKELPAYLARWDIGFMPFALNESTRFISPTKTPEFLAAGLPVVSTAVPDVVSAYGDAGLVEIGANAAGVIRAIAQLLVGRRSGWLADVDARLREESWDSAWASMNALIWERPGMPRLEVQDSAFAH
jgi:glycosyltransferase involved in cell wall biosynthesis